MPPLRPISDLGCVVSNAPVAADEVMFALNQFKSHAAPDLDGFPTAFYKKYWGIVREDIVQVV